MKDFLVVPYTFTPGLSGVGSVALVIENFTINRLVALINTTRGVVLYASGDPSKLINSVSGNVLTLSVDTSTHSASDIIQIIYNSPDPLVISLNSVELWLKSIFQSIQYPNYLDRTINAIRVAVINTIATVTTVTTLTNQTNIGSYTADVQNYAGSRTAWSQIVRGRIS
jgi:hypothetical protein